MLQQTHLLTAAATDSDDTTNPTNVMNLPEKITTPTGQTFVRNRTSRVKSELEVPKLRMDRKL